MRKNIFQHQLQEKFNFSAPVGRIWPDSIVLKAPFTGASPHMIGFVLAQLLSVEKDKNVRRNSYARTNFNSLYVIKNQQIHHNACFVT